MGDRRYEDLIAWQRAHELTIRIYKLTSLFPAQEQYGLVSQMRRCAVSIGANIAEGHSRFSPKEFRHFVSIARGSTTELDNYLLLSRDLGFIDSNTCGELRHQTGIIVKLTTRLMLSIKEL